MGSQTSTVGNANEWETVMRTPELTVLRNKDTKVEYQEYRRLVGVEKEYVRERKVYEGRVGETADNVVRVERWKGEEKKEMCTTFYTLVVYIERFQTTMERISELSFKDCLYLLIEILSATRYLLIEYPEFVIDESKIFITKNGKVKVWINQNPAENQPSPSKSLDSGEVRSQADIVQIIFDIIESRCNPDEIPYSDFMNPVRFSKMGLDQAISHIKLYCFTKKLKIGDSLQKPIQFSPVSSLHDNKIHSLTNTRVSKQRSPSQPQTHAPSRPNNFSVLNYVAEQYGREQHPQPQAPPQNCKPLHCDLLPR